VSKRRLLRRGLRAGWSWWWRDARPATGANLRGSGEAVPQHVSGRAPTPGERWTPTTPSTGPWADVDPHSAGRWPRRGSVAVVALWAGAVALRVRRDVRRWSREERTG
jgi:hypothetical protein